MCTTTYPIYFIIYLMGHIVLFHHLCYGTYCFYFIIYLLGSTLLFSCFSNLQVEFWMYQTKNKGLCFLHISVDELIHNLLLHNRNNDFLYHCIYIYFKTLVFWNKKSFLLNNVTTLNPDCIWNYMLYSLYIPIICLVWTNQYYPYLELLTLKNKINKIKIIKK